jgi:hypothetical protein
MKKKIKMALSPKWHIHSFFELDGWMDDGWIHFLLKEVWQKIYLF